MPKSFIKYSLILVYLIIFLIPGYTYFIVNRESTKLLFEGGVSSSTYLYTLFRIFGLYGFTLIWGQIVVGPFISPLARVFGPKIIKYHRTQGVFGLLFATLHPILFYLAFILTGTGEFVGKALSTYLGADLIIYGYMGVGAWSLLIITVLTALLRDKPWLVSKWHYIHLLNYLVFILVFSHSFKIGTEVALNPLNTLYLFFGASFVVSVAYRIGYRRIYQKLQADRLQPTVDNNTKP